METINSSFYKKYLSSYFLINLNFIKNDTIIAGYLDFLNLLANSNKLEEILASYQNFIQKLEGKNLSNYVKKIILKNKSAIKNNSNNEISIINSIFSTEFSEILEVFKNKFPDFTDLFENLPKYESSNLDINLEEFIENNNYIDEIFTNHNAFIFNDDLEIEPVKIAQNLTFSDLKGYKDQQNILINNTKALLEGRKVNNILLYGDAGCGKSSSVRALLNEFKEIKIIQIFKDNLINLDKLYQKLYDIPLKFIIFADDISFDDNDSTLSTMKAVLEGSLISCPKNTVIYATSNRRHLIKETFQSRIGDEIHLKETINEISSLSDRFGINLLFQKPSNDEFIDIVLQLAADNNILDDKETLINKAQKLALIKGSRSPRIARQLIDNLLAGINF